MATTNLGRIGFVPKGDWVAGTYKRLDVVTYQGSSYICKVAITTALPTDDSAWQLVASKGADGAGTGDVNGPASSTNNNVALFDGVTGRVIKDSGKPLPSSAVVGTTDAQTLTNKTIEAATLSNGYTEEIYALSGTTPALNPTNGSIQTWTLSGNSTPTDSLSNGQSIFLGITASSYTVTWPSVTWNKVGGSGAAPTLTSSGVNWVVLWKVGGTLRGAFLGTA